MVEDVATIENILKHVLERTQQIMTAPLSLNTPDSDTATRDPFRLCPSSAIITPKKLRFTSDLDQVRHIPSTKKRKAHCTGSLSSVRSLARSKGLQAKRARVLFNGAAQIQLARDAHRLGVLEILPIEIILKIIRMLEHNALELHYQRVQDFGLICLALTSIDFYKICKTVHPNPLPTTRGDAMRDENGNYWAWSLERHVSDFLGPAYKVREPDSRYGFNTRYGSPFLLKNASSEDYAPAPTTNDIFD